MIFSLPERFKRLLVILASNPIFLALVVIVLLGVSLFLLSEAKKTIKTPQIDLEQIAFSGAVKDTFTKNLEAAKSEKDQTKRFNLYYENFTVLRGVYIGNHDFQSRIQTETLAEFIKNEFPKNYKPELLSIPCLDSLCGSTNYPQEILALKPKIQAISSIEPQVLEDIFKKFEAAAFVGGQKSQWANYFDAFQSLKSEYQRTKDEKIKKVAGELSNFMQANFSETYQKIKAGQKSHYLEI
ncbi:hypothetical protein A2697_05135 [Candidatus Curtissbacteria bacterium RIFCSPHIGHO2_01_FULL_41_44]|uniref:Uncharacterized protein n=1 Tax=Candidatus Curtissbacteria bacterium RIFCSPLOWO2_01_FULL_42_50 TaxID=1797730 RepID=A0A1F5H5V2_9BACT|nr:MAG: hypothetical protein A2697_05135 [Candidatus Curtissbacteria bacterium RIFCSPHIGHO2_01_FULL_41_44]OGD93783.1 MAG: hypothetical protein A3C33_03580 [Candidatus Curtissbacteria bacterium RIFCSPHIGHO2_02_FULL_42_58]OGD96833.1 MAG: hypothetical protein A3E71_02920 [Candidatus Curtissbacteria bacterium RIFCSPHIGHO2_12_FULL_42_33]OGD99457.1 MAG: hypothetical protein A3B54_01010 [Candidatus Curtissbacteria bacterium RIFCSPLOWO2_01_FULL_42_50]OGE03718.1 MAG: hypothetical protein A3G16_02510 [Ca